MFNFVEILKVMKRLIFYMFILFIVPNSFAMIGQMDTYKIEAGIIEGLKITVVNNKVEVNLSDVSFKVYNVLGQEVPNENLKGLYMVKAKDKRGYVHVAKIIAI